jgi:carbamoyltransferase
MLLNTSFNVQEPMVCTPEDAVRTFLRSGLETLVLGP